MKSSKQRRHSGWTTPHTTISDKKINIINECLEPQIFYDDWNNYRDGYRDYLSDRTKKKKAGFIKMWDCFNSYYWQPFMENWKRDRWKIKRQLQRRKAMKLHNQHIYI